MAVITFIVTESDDQVIPGVPRTIKIEASLPSVIFYTLDGTEPTTDSSVYVSTMSLPTDLASFELKYFATNGDDSSAVITNSYESDPNRAGARLPHAQVTGLSTIGNNLGPFGSGGSVVSTAEYGNPSLVGITVDGYGNGLTDIPSGLFDGEGNSASSTDETLDNYLLKYSTTDAQGQTGANVGNLPATVTVTPRAADPQSSNKSDTLFNPRAFVIFQNQATENPEDPVQINREFFSLENPERVRDGALLYSQGLDAPTTTGSFVRSYVNEREGTITYYYYDNSVGRWLISKQPFTQKDPNLGNMSGMVFGRERTNAMVFNWRPFARRVLF